jgi:hypothetical protein
MPNRTLISASSYVVIIAIAVWFVLRMPDARGTFPVAARMGVAVLFLATWAVFDQVLPRLLADQHKWIPYIVMALLVWGGALAFGSFLYGGNHPLLRAAIVFGVTVAFVTFWLGMLASRRQRLTRGE